MSTYYIGADVHSNSTELAIEKRGKIMARYSVPTSIPAIVNVLDSLQGKKYLAVEEGPMSGWLYRNLNKKLDQFISSDPRRNKLIASDTKTIRSMLESSPLCCVAVSFVRFIIVMTMAVPNSSTGSVYITTVFVTLSEA